MLKKSSRPAPRTTIAPNAAGNGISAAISTPRLRRWDGAARTCTVWHNLKKDPELWTRHGDCLIYLHRKGQSNNGPSFKLPFSILLAAKCYPLIARSLATDSPRPRSAREIQVWYQSSPKRTVELYVAAPPSLHKTEQRRFHLMTRNFIAWLLSRSMVGENLGPALVALLQSMQDFRSKDVDNVGDIRRYLDEEGYLCFANQPNHALAVLHLAETFRIKDLYLEALTHCVGMGDLLGSRPEFDHISLSSRKLVLTAQSELETRLETTWAMISNFLQQELSDTYLGIPSSTRVHLERFRKFLLSFYSTRFGYYPPRLFDGRVYRTMATDFEALYDLLVDETYSLSEIMPSVAVGGICTLQLVQAFDMSNDMEPLLYPLPMLPQTDRHKRSKRLSFLPWGAKAQAEERQSNHKALVAASNWREDYIENELVRAYRAFEHDCAVSQARGERHEKVSLVEGRKVRWILVYAMHQVLRHATQRPDGVPDDSDANYVVSVSSDTSVPWRLKQNPTAGIEGITRSHTEPALSHAVEPDASDTRVVAAGQRQVEIKPDIDYFALTHRAPPASRSRRMSLPATRDDYVGLARTGSISRALSRSSTIRRSVRRLGLTTPTSSSPPTPIGGPKPRHHEIVVHGYGNGTNHVYMEADRPYTAQPQASPPVLASRSASTASETGSSGMSSMTSAASVADTSTSSVCSNASTSPKLESPPIEIPWKNPRRWSTQFDVSQCSVAPLAPVSKSNSLRRRSMNTAVDGYNYATKAFGQFVDQERRSLFSANRQSTCSSTSMMDSKRSSSIPPSRSMPLPIMEDDVGEEAFVLGRNSSDWNAIEAFLDGKTSDPADIVCDGAHAWEQYADLGGLTEVR